MELLKPIAITVKDPAKLPDTSRNALLSLVRSPQNPGGRLLLDKKYDVYGITETQARSWSFLLVSETKELVWLDMEYVLFAEPNPLPELIEVSKESMPFKQAPTLPYPEAKRKAAKAIAEKEKKEFETEDINEKKVPF